MMPGLGCGRLHELTHVQWNAAYWSKKNLVPLANGTGSRDGSEQNTHSSENIESVRHLGRVFRKSGHVFFFLLASLSLSARHCFNCFTIFLVPFLPAKIY
jgi:hypothetical protein